MSIAKALKFNHAQLIQLARKLKAAREAAGLSQLEVARRAFQYEKSHCKVSRVERAVMPQVDAHAIELMAKVLDVPREQLETIDPFFQAKLRVIREATRSGLWRHRAVLSKRADGMGATRVYPTRVPRAAQLAVAAG